MYVSINDGSSLTFPSDALGTLEPGLSTTLIPGNNVLIPYVIGNYGLYLSQITTNQNDFIMGTGTINLLSDHYGVFYYDQNSAVSYSSYFQRSDNAYCNFYTNINPTISSNVGAGNQISLVGSEVFTDKIYYTGCGSYQITLPTTPYSTFYTTTFVKALTLSQITGNNYNILTSTTGLMYNAQLTNGYTCNFGFLDFFFPGITVNAPQGTLVTCYFILNSSLASQNLVTGQTCTIYYMQQNTIDITGTTTLTPYWVDQSKGGTKIVVVVENPSIPGFPTGTNQITSLIINTGPTSLFHNVSWGQIPLVQISNVNPNQATIGTQLTSNTKAVYISDVNALVPNSTQTYQFYYTDNNMQSGNPPTIQAFQYQLYFWVDSAITSATGQIDVGLNTLAVTIPTIGTHQIFVGVQFNWNPAFKITNSTPALTDITTYNPVIFLMNSDGNVSLTSALLSTQPSSLGYGNIGNAYNQNLVSTYGQLTNAGSMLNATSSYYFQFLSPSYTTVLCSILPNLFANQYTSINLYLLDPTKTFVTLEGTFSAFPFQFNSPLAGQTYYIVIVFQGLFSIPYYLLYLSNPLVTGSSSIVNNYYKLRVCKDWPEPISFKNKYAESHISYTFGISRSNQMFADLLYYNEQQANSMSGATIIQSEPNYANNFGLLLANYSGVFQQAPTLLDTSQQMQAGVRIFREFFSIDAYLNQTNYVETSMLLTDLGWTSFKDSFNNTMYQSVTFQMPSNFAYMRYVGAYALNVDFSSPSLAPDVDQCIILSSTLCNYRRGYPQVLFVKNLRYAFMQWCESLRPQQFALTSSAPVSSIFICFTNTI